MLIVIRVDQTNTDVATAPVWFEAVPEVGENGGGEGEIRGFVDADMKGPFRATVARQITGNAERPQCRVEFAERSDARLRDPLGGGAQNEVLERVTNREDLAQALRIERGNDRFLVGRDNDEPLARQPLQRVGDGDSTDT